MDIQKSSIVCTASCIWINHVDNFMWRNSFGIASIYGVKCLIPKKFINSQDNPNQWSDPKNHIEIIFINKGDKVTAISVHLYTPTTIENGQNLMLLNQLDYTLEFIISGIKPSHENPIGIPGYKYCTNGVETWYTDSSKFAQRITSCLQLHATDWKIIQSEHTHIYYLRSGCTEARFEYII